MGFFNFFHKYPYTDLEELNLDWLAMAVQDLYKKISEMPEVDQNETFDNPEKPVSRPVKYFNSARNYFSGIWRTVLKDNTIFGSPLVNAGSANIATVNDVSSMARSRYNKGTCFRFAYRMPEGNPFTVDEFLAQAQIEKDVYRLYSWVYMTDLPSIVPGQFNTIPLYDPDDPSVVLNVNGKGTTCATAICNILYRLGYDELKGDAKYTEARVPGYSMIYALQARGWVRIDEESEIQAGDIVFVSAAEYGDERRFNPHHEFIYAGNNLVFDYGSTRLVQSGGKTTYDTTSYGVKFVSASWDGENMLVQGSANDANGSGSADWIGTSYTGANGGSPVRYAKMFNPDRCKHWLEYDTVSNGLVVRETRSFPISAYNVWHAITAYVKIYETGLIVFKMNGTPDTTLTAGTTYTMFSFNQFSIPGLKYINDPFDEYVLATADGKTARITATTTDGITRVTFTPQQDISSEVHCRVVMALS